MISPAPIQTSPTNRKTGLVALPWAQWFQQIVSALQRLDPLSGSELAFTPSWSAAGSMTITGVTLSNAEYTVTGTMTFFQIRAAVTVGGTPSNSIMATLPNTPAGDFFPTVCDITAAGSGNWQAGVAFTNAGTNQLHIAYSGAGNFTLGTVNVMVGGSYRST